MTSARGAVIIVAVSLAGAGLVALVARTPSSIRTEVVRGSTDPELGARFTEEEIARHGAFREVGYVAFALLLVVEIVTLAVVARGPMGRILDVVERAPGGWLGTALAAGVAVALILAVAAMPLGFVRGYVVQHQWGLSTQGVGGWLSDYARSAGVSAVVAAVSAAAFFGVVRWQPRTWWLIGWAVFSILNALFVYLWPILVAPLFNRFESLSPGPVRQEAFALADKAGVSIDDVQVADASRRSTVENAYVAGFGSGKRLVLFDTLLAAGNESETEFVIAHELGHRVERHLVKGLIAAVVGLGVGFALLAWLSGRARVWEWAGAAGIGDFRALPLLVLFAVIVGAASLPAENLLSRRFEARADEVAVELTGNRAAAVRAFRRLAYSNLADLRPPRLAVVLVFSHPSIRERIDSVTR